MALVFKSKNVATAKMQETGKTNYISTPGVTPTGATPALYAEQINKILAVGGKSVVANKNMTVTQIREVVEDE